MDIRALLRDAVNSEASDLHLVAGLPPTLRIDGEISLMEFPPLTGEDTRDLINSLLNDDQVARFEKDWELEFSYTDPGYGRFRASIYMTRGNVEASFRVVPLKVKPLESLGLPEVVADLALRPNGLVLITGPTGVGKTTTMNAMIDLINREQRVRIITIEDPIEFLHEHKRSIIIQRELDTDTHSFQVALIHSLRQDPNVIVVGEMRDLETIQTALTAAETGHLVIATLHTADATQTVDRIVDVFPPHQQTQIRIQLASCIQGVVSQQLLPRVGEKGRVAAVEVMVATQAVRHVIRDSKSEQLFNIISIGKDQGMQTMDWCLKDLYRKGIITYDTALSRVKDPDFFRAL